MTPVTRPDWGEIRRTYDGGRGGTLEEMSKRFGVPMISLARRSSAEGWRRASQRADEIRRRVYQLVAEEPELGPTAIRLRVQQEFGDDPGIPTTRAIRHIKAGSLRPWQRDDAPMPEPTRETLEGLTRVCYGCGQRTSHDPCQWCAVASDEVAA